MRGTRVERLLQAAEAFNATKRPDLEFVAADVEIIQPDESGKGEAVYYGRDGYARVARELTDAFDDFRIDMKQVFERGDYVVSFVRLRGRARTTGGRIDAPFAYVLTFKGDLVSRFHVYSNRGEALKAAGLVDPAEIEAARVRI